MRKKAKVEKYGLTDEAMRRSKRSKRGGERRGKERRKHSRMSRVEVDVNVACVKEPMIVSRINFI